MNDTPVVEQAPVPQQIIDPETALKEVLKKALIHDGLTRGLRETVKALDRREALLCVLAQDCNEAAYVTLITALCLEHSIPLMKVSSAKLLGEWAGLRKLDKEGKARKVVAASSVAIKTYGEDSEYLAYLQNHLKSL